MKELFSCFLCTFVLFFGVKVFADTVVSAPQNLTVSAIVVSDSIPPIPETNSQNGSMYIAPTSVIFSGSAYSYSKVFFARKSYFAK